MANPSRPSSGPVPDLSSHQRDALCRALGEHPRAVSARDARLLLRLCAIGLVREVAPHPPLRRFELTQAGLDRAGQIAESRRKQQRQVVGEPTIAGPLVLQASTARLYPTTAQFRAMSRIGGQCRALWNHWLAANRDQYQATKRFTFFHEMSASLPTLRREERFDGLPHLCAQITLQHLDRALRDSFHSLGEEKKGFPKFKRRQDQADTFHFVGRNIEVRNESVRLPMLGWVRARGLRIPASARLLQATVRQTRRGFELSVQFEAPAPQSLPAPVLPAVGLDMGVRTLVTLSTGRKVANPKHRQRHQRRLARLQRTQHRRRKGSVNRRRVVAKIARIHKRITDQRSDYLHKLSHELVKLHEGVCVEDLDLKRLAQQGCARTINDAGLGELRRLLEYKTLWYGRAFGEMGTFRRSTGVCPACETTGPRLKLGIVSWTCLGCGAVHDRDVAAAQVILRRAVLRVTEEPAAAMPRKRGIASTSGKDAIAPDLLTRPPTNVALGRALREEGP